MKHLPFRILIICRLVNKVWKSAVDSIPVYREFQEMKLELMVLARENPYLFVFRSWEAGATSKLLHLISQRVERIHGQTLLRLTKPEGGIPRINQACEAEGL